MVLDPRLELRDKPRTEGTTLPTEWAAICDILQSFDFSQIQEFMQTVDWKWGDETPTVAALRLAAERLLNELFEDPDAVALELGGLRVDRVFLDDGVWEMKLSFEAQASCAEFTR